MSEARRLDGLVSFFSSHHALRAERIVTREGLYAQLVPGPKDLSPNCGVALRFEYARKDQVVALLAAHRIRIDGVYRYQPRTDRWGASARAL